MNSLSSGIGPEEKRIYEPQGINFQNISQAKSKKLGKDLYLLTAKKKTRPAVFEVLFLEPTTDLNIVVSTVELELEWGSSEH